MKNYLLLFFAITPLLFLSGCNWFGDDPCADNPDSKHCYQAQAVEA